MIEDFSSEWWLIVKSKRALWNVIINTLVQILQVVLAFVVRKVFLMTLGADILGLNSLFSSILAFLSLTELGLGVSVSMCLYKPLAENDTIKITAYMYFLKKVYTYIGIAIFVIGICITPFLQFIVNGDYSYAFIVEAFILYLSSTAVTYFFSYKKILLNADQKSYIVSAAQVFYKIILNIGQILVLLITQNYFLFLTINVICNLTENIIVSNICSRQYPFLRRKEACLDKEEKLNLRKKVTGMLCYKLSNYLIEGIDNIIISTFLGTVVVAYYSNYYLVINMLFAIFACIGTSSVAGLGNILSSDKKRLRSAFSRLLLVQHFVFSFSASAMLVLVSDFVEIFFGTDSVLPFEAVILMVAIYYIKGFSQGIEALRNSAGLFEKDKYVNLMLACLNIIISVSLVVKIGIIGVLVGTIICFFIKEVVIVPWYVMQDMEADIGKWYTWNFIKYTAVTCMIMLICLVIHDNIFIINEYITWILNGTLCFAVSVVINILVFRKTDEMKQSLNLLSNILKRNS